jgi:hypothetical protein
MASASELVAMLANGFNAEAQRGRDAEKAK